MKTIKEIREAIDATLDRLQTKAEAAEVQMNLGKMELEQRFETHYQELATAATELQTRLTEAGVSGEEAKTNLQGALEQLRVQLALGEMDSRDAIENLRAEVDKRVGRFNEAIDAVKHQGDGELVGKIEAAMDHYVRQAAGLKAEIEARADKLKS